MCQGTSFSLTHPLRLPNKAIWIANMVVSSNALVAGLALRVSIEVVQQDVAIAYVYWLSHSIEV